MLAAQSQLLHDDAIEPKQRRAPVLTLVQDSGRNITPHPLMRYATARRDKNLSGCRFALGEFLNQHFQERANASVQ